MGAARPCPRRADRAPGRGRACAGSAWRRTRTGRFPQYATSLSAGTSQAGREVSEDIVVAGRGVVFLHVRLREHVEAGIPAEGEAEPAALAESGAAAVA